MGLFDGLFRKKDGPTNRTAGNGYSLFMGGSAAGKTVTECNAMRMTAVYACVSIPSETVAGLPLQVYKYNEDGGREKALDYPMRKRNAGIRLRFPWNFLHITIDYILIRRTAYERITNPGKPE